MRWLACTIRLSPESIDLASYYLFELGAQGIQELEGHIIAYFSDMDEKDLQTGIEAVFHDLRSAGMPVFEESILIEAVPQEDWHAGWRKYFKPILIDDILCVRPPWEKVKKRIEHHVIIEPKQAFGTGNHATTRLMLEAIAGKHHVLPTSVLDLGTGSGILAIAHCKLKPTSQIIGVDIDPIAIENAVENAELNGVAEGIKWITGTFDDVPDQSFPMIYANLQRHIIIPLLPQFKARLQPDGTILFSGILVTEEVSMRVALDENGFSVIRQKQLEEWILLEVRHS
ncbi:MAG: 50S ribosomal protein L11 methyltransferase [Deferribacteres bacterium]|nr:50S ribosomal protein L11 methyltransferase [candidate division KSB1 bacterium]MCB9503010.1 50S ribosomal protein L11 methyltransferase [Deferribacteres bacterium]